MLDDTVRLSPSLLSSFLLTERGDTLGQLVFILRRRARADVSARPTGLWVRERELEDRPCGGDCGVLFGWGVCGE